MSKDPARVAAGLKAAINNPNVSEDAKERAMNQLDGLGNKLSSSSPPQTQRRSGRRGSVSASPQSSPARERAPRRPSTDSDDDEKHVNFVDEEQPKRILEGYRDALHDPTIDEDEKTHARELLEFHGESVK